MILRVLLLNNKFMEDQKQENSGQTAANSTPPTVDKADAKKNKGIAMVAYIVFFVPLISAKDSKFAMYHANQGLILLIAAVAANVVLSLIPILGWFIMGLILPLVILGFAIIGIINASKGEMKPLPYIGGFEILK
jgi:uncharacterized membrane protein